MDIVADSSIAMISAAFMLFRLSLDAWENNETPLLDHQRWPD